MHTISIHPMPKPLSTETVALLRMHSLLLGAKQLKSVCDIARWFGAMQSQDLASGKWSFGVRLSNKTERDIDAAIERGEVLRTWPMRGTIHFVPAEDVRWMLETTGVKALARAASRRAFIGLEEATANHAADVLGKALAGGRRLTRAQAVECLRAKGMKVEGQQAYHLLWYASQMGVTCIGPNQGKEQAFVLLADWAKKQAKVTGDEALATLALRYFRSHGPVTQQDFMGWTGLSAAEAKRGIAAVEKQLMACDYGGKTQWMSKSLFDEVAKLSYLKSPRVQVLPGFDEYLLGIKDRSVAVPAAHKNKIIPGGNGMFMSTMVVDGIVVGTWKRTLKKAVVELQPQPFRTVPRALRSEFDTAFADYARYLGLEPRVNWT